MFRVNKLNNGLTVCGEENHLVRSVSVGIMFKVGSENENKENNGISHFIEHMLFKGTKRRSSLDIANEIDYIGGEINAFTTKNYTCFYVHVTKNHFDKAIDVLSDMVLNSTFDEEEIEKEKKVIIEEMNIYEDSSEDYAYDSLSAKIYGDKGIGLNILGTRESVESMNREKLIDFYNKNYTPDNAIISFCGNITYEVALRKLQQHFIRWNTGFKGDLPKKIDFRSIRSVEERYNDQVQISIIFDKYHNNTYKDEFISEIVTNYFASSPSSVLFQNIRERKGLVYGIDMRYSDYAVSSEFEIYASTSIAKVEEVVDLIFKYIDELKTNFITDEKLKKLKSQLIGYYFLDLEDTHSRMMWAGRSKIFRGDILSDDEATSITNSITPQEVRLMIDSSFNRARLGINVVGKGAEQCRAFIENI